MEGEMLHPLAQFRLQSEARNAAMRLPVDSRGGWLQKLRLRSFLAL